MTTFTGSLKHGPTACLYCSDVLPEERHTGKGYTPSPGQRRETPLGAPRATLGVLSLKPKGTPWVVITLFYISEILYNN